jgi:hypothetical protein
MWSGPQLGCGINKMMVLQSYIIASFTLYVIHMQSETNTGPKIDVDENHLFTVLHVFAL